MCKRCIFLALETMEVPFKTTIEILHLHIHTDINSASPSFMWIKSSSLFTHSNHRSLDETVLRCILQVSTKLLFFYCFPKKKIITFSLYDIHICAQEIHDPMVEVKSNFDST